MKLVRYEELWVLVPPSKEVLQSWILGPKASPRMWVEIPDELYERLEKSHKEFMEAATEAAEYDR